MGEKVGLDTSIFIYFLQRNLEYIVRVRNLIDEIEAGRIEAVFSNIGLIEVLTGPKKQGRFDLAKQYKDLIINFPNLTIYGINERIIETASDLRANYGITVPDAVHLATAIDFGAEKFITNDKELLKVKEVKVELLQ